MLKIQFRDGSSDAVRLAPPGITIGQGNVNDIVIDEPGVNGFHADLKVEANQVTISDVNTGSGTYVNGEKILAPMPIRAGDSIRVGSVELEIIEENLSGGAKTLVLSGTALLEMGSGGWALVANSGPEKGQIIPIKDRTEIGRALECDISILEPSLSRKHAEIYIENGDLIIQDLGSVNGTYVNAKKVDKHSLKDGDVLQFQNINFIVNAP
ncbi:MAG: pSer/pThr/pTyr-binding forkhead associated (FHA) protein [Candidatus Azotimanducaceae bacterium]|jgi:pSer/pThr/pTyr-binding forkhead associated (FHA) protein